MNKIAFRGVLPQVFSNLVSMNSDIWKNDLLFEKGRYYLIEADSGKGKSTFCSYITGYRNDYSGSICFDETDTQAMKVSDWVDVRRHHVSHLFQELRLFPELTAFENVQIKNSLTGYTSTKQIEEWFDRMGIADKLTAKVGRMSFGQQQRVAFIRALVQPFDFILADEPISHLDEGNAQIMCDILQEETRRQGSAVIVTSIGKHLDLPYHHVLKL
ncbi:MAG: ATP-binding cassette domain-containing protein [Prevotellaceae bacterium]|nr:ATP-binding cassette domain-containing protein [Prevotellaceae bacterium]